MRSRKVPVTFPRKTPSRNYINPNVHFSERALAKTYIFPQTYFPELHLPQFAFGLNYISTKTYFSAFTHARIYI